MDCEWCHSNLHGLRLVYMRVETTARMFVQDDRDSNTMEAVADGVCEAYNPGDDGCGGWEHMKVELIMEMD